jgi:CarD family transcriptional regulator
VNLTVGDAVVYGAHGAGLVSAREQREVFGEPDVVVVVALAHGLSVALPLARAEELLRPVAGEAELKRIQRVLSAPPEPGEESWLRRQREAQAKLTSTKGLAEILRDGADRDEGNQPRSRLSPSERELFRKARELLANEIALSRGVGSDEANEWIDRQLSLPSAA